jgi:signal transduction histidine kinase
MLRGMQLTLAVLSLLLAVFYFRHADDVPEPGFRWLGAAFAMYCLNHVGTTWVLPAWQEDTAFSTWVHHWFSTVTAAITLSGLLTGFHLYSGAAGLPAGVRGARLFALGVLGFLPLLIGLISLAPAWTHLVPAAIFVFVGWQQFRLQRAFPGLGHGIVAVLLWLHPLALLVLLMLDADPLWRRDILSAPYVLAGLGILTVTLRRARVQADRAQQAMAERLAQQERTILGQQREQMLLVQQATRRGERERLLADMHDGLGSQLAAAMLRAERGALGPDEMAELLRESLFDLNLMADTLDDSSRSLADAFVDYRQRCEQRYRGIAVDWEWQFDLQSAPDLPPRWRLHVLRVVQEAVGNALRHGSPRSIRVSAVYFAGGLLQVSILDDGAGLPAEPVPGRGLRNMHRRAQELGGSLHIGAGPTGGGVEVLLGLPVPG